MKYCNPYFRFAPSSFQSPDPDVYADFDSYGNAYSHSNSDSDANGYTCTASRVR